MKRFRLRSAFIVAMLLGIAAVLWFAFIRNPMTIPTTPMASAADDIVPEASPLDPRLHYATDFRNVQPDVRYVGDAKCAACHGDICTSYHAHPMGRSASVGKTEPIEKFDRVANNPWKLHGYELSITDTPGGHLHRVTASDSKGGALPAYTVPSDLAIGSGTRGRSYLSVESGSVWQSPISWFGKESRWDISPGFDLGTGGRRAIVPSCLYCHVDQAEPIPQTLNRYRAPVSPIQTSIGCERCHGPGELHVKERLAGKSATKVDTSIVNPKHLPAALQASICEQCHLQGQERIPRRGRSEFEYRPGLPFSEFVTVFVRHPDLAEAHQSVGQFEQMELSRCSPAGGGHLQCTSCHDPHKAPPPAERDAFYNKRCATCHETKGCTAAPPERLAKLDSCIACHMPRADSTSIAHASVTDHRILRKPGPALPPKGLPPGANPLVAFRPDVAHPEMDRDLGIALARLAANLTPGSTAQWLMGKQARERLLVHLSNHKGDVDAWIAMGMARGACGEPKERLAAAENAAKLAPDSEVALAAVAEAALANGRFDRAEEASTKLIGMSPRSVEHYATRATARALRKQWAKAEEDCRAALAIHPLHPQSRLILAACLHGQGNAEAGKIEAETAYGLATKPAQKSAFRDWFLREVR